MDVSSVENPIKGFSETKLQTLFLQRISGFLKGFAFFRLPLPEGKGEIHRTNELSQSYKQATPSPVREPMQLGSLRQNSPLDYSAYPPSFSLGKSIPPFANGGAGLRPTYPPPLKRRAKLHSSLCYAQHSLTSSDVPPSKPQSASTAPSLALRCPGPSVCNTSSRQANPASTASRSAFPPCRAHIRTPRRSAAPS